MKIGIILVAVILFQASYSLFQMTCNEAVTKFRGYTCESNPNLGEGASGRAFLVRQNNSPYYFRVLKVQEVKDPSKKKRALWEAQILNGISHTNIIQIFEAVQVNDFLFETLEFGAQGSLSAYIGNKRTLFDDKNYVLGFFRQLLLGVKHLHTQGGIVHADLKTENIVIDKNGVPKIIDFDLAVKYDSREAIRGTLMYMEPALMFPQETSFKYDELTDVYALGIILYEMSHGGTFPFSDASEALIKKKTRDGIYTLKANIDSFIAFMIIGCLRFNRSDRLTIDQLISLTDRALVLKGGKFISTSLQISNKESHSMIYFGSIIRNEDDYVDGVLIKKKNIAIDNNPKDKVVYIDRNKRPEPQRREVIPKPRPDQNHHYVQDKNTIFDGRFFTVLAALVAIILLTYFTILIFCRSRRSGYYTSSGNTYSTHTTRVVSSRTPVVNSSSTNQRVVVVREPVIIREPVVVTQSTVTRSPNIVRSNNVVSSQTTTTYTRTVK